jgi:DNA-binding MarR family transcriptional regulator
MEEAMRQDTSQEAKASVGDVVDGIVAEWERERPELDVRAKHMTGRILRLASIFQHAYADSFEPLGLNEGDYGVLAPLRRAGNPYTLSPTALADHRMMTTGGMTKALDRLERKGFIERLPNPADRRGSLVRLTESGRVVVDEAMSRHTRVERELMSSLDESEQTQLTSLLRKVLAAVDRH